MKTKLVIVTVKYLDKPRSNNHGIKTIIVDNTPPNKNLGFAAGVNRGIKKALKEDATHVLLVNPDVVVTNYQINKLLEAKGDIVSPVLKFKRQGEWIYDFGGKVNWLLGRTYHIEKYEIDLGPQRSEDRNRECDYVSGACMLIRKEVVEKTGLFDERYFMYFEDCDFCLRARKAGFTVSVAKDVIVDHQISEQRTVINVFKIKQNLKSNLVFVNRWVPWYFKPIAYSYLFLVILKIIYNLTFVESSTT